jgi:AraC-like DNA-binding protein
MTPPYPAYEERPSDSPFIHNFGWGITDGEGTAPLHADSQWYLLFRRQNGETRIMLGGPVTKTWFLPYSAGGEWFGIRFSTGTFLPHLPAAPLVNNFIVLPQASRKHFWLNGCAWEIPTLENAETFVRHLLREDMLIRDPLLDSVLLDQPQEMSFSTVRRRFLRAAGVTPGVLHQVQRARKASALLLQGFSILDTIDEAGYFDQPHLTRSLKYYMGYTPAQLVRVYQPYLAGLGYSALEPGKIPA